MDGQARDKTYLAAMAKGVLPYTLDQRLLLPPDMRAWLPEGYLALFVRDVVERGQGARRVSLHRAHAQPLEAGSRWRAPDDRVRFAMTGARTRSALSLREGYAPPLPKKV